MITGFERIIIETPDIAAALTEYGLLFGELTPTKAEAAIDLKEKDRPQALIPLANVALAIKACAAIKKPRIMGISLLDDSAKDTPAALMPRPRGLEIYHTAKRHGPSAGTAPSGITAVDHLVLMSTDADDCIQTFGEQGLGIRLALDQKMPEWGGRMLFFRVGKMTLEVIHNQENPPKQDFFWGITYQCANLESTLAYLDTNDVAHSPLRTGRKPGTVVATLNSGDLGIPTLLIQHG